MAKHPAKQPAAKRPTKVVHATGVAVGLNSDRTERTKRVEKAMSDAIDQAAKDGITGDDQVRDLILAAHRAAVAVEDEADSQKPAT